METKICRGPLHPEGVELPIENFALCKPSNRKSPYRIYQCKECMKVKRREESQIRRKANPGEHSKYCRERYHNNAWVREQVKIEGREYCRTEAGKASRKRWLEKKLISDPNYLKNLERRQRDNLSDVYVKRLLLQLFRPRFTLFGDISQDTVKVKRALLELYRETKTYYHGKDYRTEQNL